MEQDLFDLNKFDEYREGNRREVKGANGGLPNSLWETYSAFANCDGGIIILGVKENNDGSWYTTHLQNERKLIKDFWDIINNKNKVNINLLKEDDVKTYKLDDDVIITIKVPRAGREYKPVYINDRLFGGTYRRNYEGDYCCSESEVRGMLRDQAERSADEKILSDMDLSVLNQDSIKSFRSRHKVVNENHVWHKLDDSSYLERIGAAKILSKSDEFHPTVAGLLMFGEEYKIRYEFPEYFLDYREMLDPSIRWTDRLESSSGEWSGNLIDFFFQMERRLLRDLKTPFKLDGITRVDETSVHKAIREALANCIANADFNFSRGIVIKKEPELLTIENPGSIITGKQQMIKGGISEPRNKVIMKMFNLIKVGERAGSGVPDIFSVWNEEGWVEPIVEEHFHPDRTILSLAFKEKQAEKTSGKNKRKKQAEKTSGKIYTPKTVENKREIVDYITQNKSAKTKELADVLELSEARARAIIGELVEEGALEARGNGRSRHYIISKQK